MEEMNNTEGEGEETIGQSIDRLGKELESAFDHLLASIRKANEVSIMVDEEEEAKKAWRGHLEVSMSLVLTQGIVQAYFETVTQLTQEIIVEAHDSPKRQQ